MRLLAAPVLVGMTVAWVLIAGPLGASGSFPREGAWAPLACDPSPGARPSGNAPTLPIFQGSLDEFARRLAEALGDPLDRSRDKLYASEEAPRDPSPVPAGEIRRVWATGHGQILYETHPSPFTESIRYEPDGVWPSLDATHVRQAIDRMLKALAPGIEFSVDVNAQPWESGPTEYIQVLVQQTLAGEAISPPVINARAIRESPADAWPKNRSTAEFVRIHDLGAAEKRLSAEDATRLAEAFAACAHGRAEMEQGFMGPPGLDVRHGSLAYRVHLLTSLELGCHDGITIYVDAVTGAILADEVGFFTCFD